MLDELWSAERVAAIHQEMLQKISQQPAAPRNYESQEAWTAQVAMLTRSLPVHHDDEEDAF